MISRPIGGREASAVRVDGVQQRGAGPGGQGGGATEVQGAQARDGPVGSS